MGPFVSSLEVPPQSCYGLCLNVPCSILDFSLMEKGNIDLLF